MQQYHQKRPLSSRRVSPIFLLILFLVGGWFLFRYERPEHTPEAEPRAVTARGNLAQDEQNSIEVFRAVSPSVVYITTIELRRSLFNMNVYEIPQGTGSGFVWDTKGRIVTNYHVIGEANRVDVTLPDQSTWKGTLIGVAPDKDIAVLQINAPADHLKPITLGVSSNLLVGQKVFAIGNPFGLDLTMTSGIVSALGREIRAVTGRTIQEVIQTDAAINPGNSGGPLLDSAGRMIGVNTAIYSPSGVSAGIGFAVPVDVVNRVVPEIIQYGRVIHPGLNIDVANDRIAKRLGIKGVLVINVHPGSAAEKAGLIGTRKEGGEIVLGDIIQGINGKAVLNSDDLSNEMDKYRVGDKVKVQILRDDKQLELPIVLEDVS